MEPAPFIIFVVWMALCIYSWTAQNKLYKAIAKDHPIQWEKMGKPAISMMWQGFTRPPWEHFSLMLNMIRSMLSTLRYFIKGDAELDADPNILKLKRKNQKILLVMIGVFVLFIVLAIVDTYYLSLASM